MHSIAYFLNIIHFVIKNITKKCNFSQKSPDDFATNNSATTHKERLFIVFSENIFFILYGDKSAQNG